MGTSIAHRALTIAVGAIMSVSVLSLTACSIGDGANELGGTRATLSDHGEWTSVADSSGRIWSTVLRIEATVGSDLDEEKLVKDLRDAKNFDWTKVICSDNRATNKKEVAYLLLVTSSDYSQIKSAVAEIQKAGWTCTMLDVTAYETYLDQVKGGTYEFAETTYSK